MAVNNRDRISKAFDLLSEGLQEMEVLTNEVKEVFELLEKGLIYIKIVKSDRHDYEPHF